MTKFNLTTALSERREQVIAKYNTLTTEEFFDGCTLRQFMIEVMNMCQMNNIKSSTRLNNFLPMTLGQIYVAHSKVSGSDAATEQLKKRYEGTSYMSMV
jgi:hypothetical protein